MPILEMTTATEYLDAFNNSFVNKDKSFIDAIMADNCMIHFTGLDETMTRQECLEWSETDFCAGCAACGLRAGSLCTTGPAAAKLVIEHIQNKLTPELQ